MRYGYYPGCSMPHSAAPYELSTQAVVKTLGVALEEIDDWNCCGATEYIALNKMAAAVLKPALMRATREKNGSPTYR